MSSFKSAFSQALGHTWRDRSTYLSRVLFPLFLLLAAIYLGVFAGMSSMKQGAAKVGIIGLVEDSPLLLSLEEIDDIEWVVLGDGTSISELIEQDSLVLALEVEEGFADRIGQGRAGSVLLYYHSQKSGMTKETVLKTLKNYENELLSKRLDSLNLSEQFIDPISIEEENTYRWMEHLPRYVGSVLPFFMVLFAFLACIFSTLDLFDKEKTTGVPSKTTAFANWLMTVLVGLDTAILTALGLYFVVNSHPLIPIMVKNLITSWFSLKSMGLILLAMIPMLLFFAVFLSLIRRVASSYKRAQNTIQSLKIFVIMAFAVVFLPFAVLEGGMQFWPGTNVALFGREVIIGAWTMGQLVTVSLVLLGYSLVGMVLFFRRKRVV